MAIPKTTVAATIEHDSSRSWPPAHRKSSSLSSSPGMWGTVGHPRASAPSSVKHLRRGRPCGWSPRPGLDVLLPLHEDLVAERKCEHVNVNIGGSSAAGADVVVTTGMEEESVMTMTVVVDANADASTSTDAGVSAETAADRRHWHLEHHHCHSTWWQTSLHSLSVFCKWAHTPSV